jgi:intein/homing endonuclease
MTNKKTTSYQRRKNVEYQRKRAIAGRKAAKKLKGRVPSRTERVKQKRYREILKSYLEKQKNIGGKYNTYKKAQQSPDMKTILKDLKSGDPFLQKRALEMTTRRDGVPETIPVGETPSVYSEAA